MFGMKWNAGAHRAGSSSGVREMHLQGVSTAYLAAGLDGAPADIQSNDIVAYRPADLCRTVGHRHPADLPTDQQICTGTHSA